MGNPPIFLVIFALFWTGVVGAFDVTVGGDVMNGVRSGSFPTTTGTIISSKVTENGGDEGPNCRAEIRYRYNVLGFERTGDTYRFGMYPPSGSHEARDVVAAHRVGQPVTVYYDPSDTTLSVLKPGLDGSALFMMLFLTPFNVVTLGLWWIIGPQIWHWWRGTMPAAAPWFRQGGATHVRLPSVTAAGAGLIAAGFGAFIAIFIIGFTTSFQPSVEIMLLTWGIVLALAFAAGVNTRRKERQGAFDMVIRDRFVELPAMYGRTRRCTLDRAAISGVTIEKCEHQQSEKSTTYDVRFKRRDGGHETIVSWYDGPTAERFAAWLRDLLGLR